VPEIVIKIPKLGRKLERELAKRIEFLSKVEIARFLLLERWNKIFSKSKLTERDCIKLGREIKKKMWKRYEAEGW